ncbi:dTDP-4-amino-4,6-dideoxyglucose formyltransferase [Fusobacterium ulcerans]|uniref:dTDP-4-amino-4,6-dideoxyglucose formyltransferase n=1 Tax=Fusobacterium ulcerans TaxID=861 RepID=UPI001D0BE099|nr:dTDP-4-amino-4,6-dideoxyglucose formyltransferase [Fusobacterium ulcerans]MCB8566258.1 dTDP-4-amino-4,6-dideoxyglucose formyltransferase [Fusobacterium ulcerans]MCB8650250.1 dTDP-4-amino-4,6-dideoxyglucose formyltransferase [Fusobacterium ulcerans]
MKILVITDNEYIFQNFLLIIKNEKYKNFKFSFRYSLKNTSMKEKYLNSEIFKPINVKEEVEDIIKNYDMVFSLHCKQIFPAKLVNVLKCINVHPGLNPYNRGWFPQVFSILNKLDCGVTIHYMDEYLDHGKILFQEKVSMYDWDTSLSLYNRIQNKEIELLEKNLYDILTKNIEGFKVEEGNINTLNDFKKLCEIDLDEKITMREAIDKLRALSHGEYKNAYFTTDNKKIYVQLFLEKEEKK